MTHLCGLLRAAGEKLKFGNWSIFPSLIALRTFLGSLAGSTRTFLWYVRNFPKMSLKEQVKSRKTPGVMKPTGEFSSISNGMFLAPTRGTKIFRIFILELKLRCDRDVRNYRFYRGGTYPSVLEGSKSSCSGRRATKINSPHASLACFLVIQKY